MDAISALRIDAKNLFFEFEVEFISAIAIAVGSIPGPGDKWR